MIKAQGGIRKSGILSPWRNPLDPGDRFYLRRRPLGYDVIMLSGQSNMVGRNGPIDSTLDATDSRIYMFGFDSQIVEIASDPLDQVDETSNTVGPGLSIAKYYADNLLQSGRKILIVPAADGGTGFGSGYWRPGGTGYSNAVARCNSALAIGSGENRLIFVAWHQGETDMAMTETEYRTEIDNLISGFRNDIAGAGGVPFVLGGVNSNSTQYSDGVFKATYSRQLAGDDVAFVGTEDLELAGDSLHFTAAASREMGKRYARAFSKKSEILIDNFEQDTVSQTENGLTPLRGAVTNVVDSGSSVFTGKYVTFSGSNGEESFRIEGAPSAKDQIVQMRVDSAGQGRLGVMLRHSGNGTSFSGYLLQINPEFDDARIYRAENGSFTLLGSGSIVIGNYTYWRFWVRSDLIVIEYSVDGIVWQEGIRITDSVISGSGNTAIFCGFGRSYTGLYVGEVRVGGAVI